MAIATWWYGDPRPVFSDLPEFRVKRATDVGLIARLNGIPETEVRTRFEDGHQVFVGTLEEEPVSYGWLAMRSAHIGEVRLRITLPPRSGYLWDFGTLEPVRGRGLYPRLLNAIRDSVTPEFTRLWIIHSPENGPSAVGIERAGFTSVGELSFDSRSTVRLRPLGRPERSIAAAALFGVMTTEEPLSACWTCENSIPCGCRNLRHSNCACHLAARKLESSAGFTPERNQ